jgi:hypothetical protein
LLIRTVFLRLARSDSSMVERDLAQPAGIGKSEEEAGIAMPTHPASASALELARGVAGHIVTGHAGLADIEALIELPCVIVPVTLGDADALLLGQACFLRTRRQADRCRHQNNGAAKLHGAFSDR